MAVDQRSHSTTPWPVSLWVANEVEDQILGGTQTHTTAAQQLCLALETYARRLLLPWLVRQETHILYPRVHGPSGSFYPDCLVAHGVTLDDMAPYDIATVGRPPELVVEIISRKTARKDRETKVQAYAEMGVQEYITFDPRPRKKLELKGYRLVGRGHYTSMPQAPDGGLWIATLGLRLVPEPPAEKGRGPRVRPYTAAGDRLLFTEEEAAARIAAEQERAAALAEVARLRSLLAQRAPDQ